MTSRPRIVLACSGAPRTIAAIPALRRRHGADLVAVTLDLGEGRDLDDVRERALAAGAVRAHVLDVRETFAREYILPALHAGALDPDGGPMRTALGRPLIAKTLVEIARIEHAGIAAHGCLPDGGDQARIEQALRALDASIRLVAVSGARMPPAAVAVPRPAAVPAAPASVELAFDRGVPVAVNGVEMTLAELLDSIATIAAAHRVGSFLVLHTAHQALEALVTPPALRREMQGNAAAYVALVQRGDWFSPGREALDAFTATLQERVTGAVRVDLVEGACTITGRRSPFALEPART